VALRKTVVVLAVLALAVLPGVPGPGAASAVPGPGVPDLESVAKRLAAPATQEAAILALREVGDPSVGTLLRALKDGALYRWKGRLAILGDDGALKDLAGQPIVDDRGQPVSPAEGQEAIALDVPAPVISLALWMRFRSRQDESFAGRLLAAMRQQFGGHAVRPAGKD